MKARYHLIVDFEATCCNDNTFSKSEMEIIEIGAVIVSETKLEVVSEFQIFVRPTKNPKLTDYCKQLTNIHQEDVDNAPCFIEAVDFFKKWLNTFTCIDFCSWGKYDDNQLKRDSDYYNIPVPISLPHRNLKKEFAKFLGINKKYGLIKALSRIGMKFEGVHHRALDDVRNIAKVFKKINTGKLH